MQSFFSPLPFFSSSSSSSYARLIHYRAERKGGAGGMSRVVGVRAVCASPFSQYIIDAVFLLLEHLCCIMHIKFMESIIVYQPWEAWEHFSLYLNLLHVKYIRDTLSASFLSPYNMDWFFFLNISESRWLVCPLCSFLFCNCAYETWSSRMSLPLGLCCTCGYHIIVWSKSGHRRMLINNAT